MDSRELNRRYEADLSRQWEEHANRSDNPEDNMVCIIDANRGRYAPQAFAQWLKSQTEYTYSLASAQQGDLYILLDGPDFGQEDYWEIMDSLEENLILTDKDGGRWTVYQDQDIFLVREGYQIPE